MNATIRLGLALVLTGIATGPLSAHEGATGVVKDRMEAMEAMGRTAKTISRRLEANRNLAAIKEDAGKLQEIAARLPAWFPPGSNEKPSEAKPELWQQWDVFLSRAKQLELASGELATLATGGDPRAIARQYQLVGNACVACHDAFRLKR